MTGPRAVDDENDPWIDRWPVEPAGITVDDGYDRDVWYLYGPHGEILSTWSDRPPFGFHQGERGVPR